MAVLMARDGNLTDVVRIGDAINHAIFTINELRGGFRRLEMAKLIQCEQGHYRATDSAREILRPIRSKGLDIFSEVGEMCDYLTSEFRVRSDPDYVPSEETNVSQAQLEEAVRVYKAWFAEQLEKARRRTES